ncbi:High mobility group box domain containing protein [Parasponia andersonii]|uniref:High mobility group box domain containing protein n=1 Tax=Parasponia andersonii TaxID=3476 RepID=A0A2P5D5Z8_PARAD|nr:High mobility group box domain containing protein [Parasponia andersonii]
MRGPKSSAIAHKKPETEMLLNQRKAGGANATKNAEKASKKSSDAPKRPSGAFFIFMEEFRKSFKENFPDVKSCSAEKGPYIETAVKRKTEYEKAVKAYKIKLMNDNGGDEKAEESEKSSSEINEETGENDSS